MDSATPWIILALWAFVAFASFYGSTIALRRYHSIDDACREALTKAGLL